MDSPEELTSSPVFCALSELGRLGYAHEAIEHLERIDQILPVDAAYERSRLLQHGAALACNIGDFERMERYLQAVLDLQPLFARKRDSGCQERAVRKFRVFHGLLSPQDAIDERERVDATFKQHLRTATDAIRRHDAAIAAARLRQAEGLLLSMERWQLRHSTAALLRAYSEMGDTQNVRRLAECDRSAERDVRLSPRDLLKAGHRDLAVARFKTEAHEALEELRRGTMNAHFPAYQLERAICGLADAGDEESAKLLLGRTLAEGESWHLSAPGAFTSAVFASVARAVARVQGSEAALTLVKLSIERAKSDRKSDWRSTAILSNAELLIELSPPAERSAIASKIRSPKSRSRLLTKIAAEQQDWDRLHELLSIHKRPIEAAEAIWWMKFVWRPAA